jgi:hypothetical protein
MMAKRTPIDSTTKNSEDGWRTATDRVAVDWTSEQNGMGVAQIRRVAGLPADNGFTEANRAKFRLVALGILVIDVILFAALGGSATVSDDPEEAFASLEPIAGFFFAFIIIVTWILLAVAVKAGFGKRRPSPPKDPL